MARTNQRDTDLRRVLETIAVEVAFIQRVSPVTRMRVQQGLDHTGLTRLFDPALHELDDVSRSVCEIGKQARSALAMLLE